MLIGLYACRQNSNELAGNVVELPVTFVEGFGPFGSSYGVLAAEYTLDNAGGAGWVKTYLPVRGIPEKWKKVVRSMVVLDYKQLVYQNFFQGNIDSSMYFDLQKSWDWEPDSTRLSRLPVRCYVYVIRGMDESGKTAVMIDSNNNLDFADEVPFYPETASKQDTLRYYKKSHRIEFDVFRDGKVLVSHVPMVIKHLPENPSQTTFLYSFPQYAEAVIKVSGQEYPIAFNNGFTAPATDEDTELLLVDRNQPEKSTEKVSLGHGIAVGEFIDFGTGNSKKRYKNLGYNPQRGVLQLQGGSIAASSYSTQPGFLFRSFSGNEFTSGKPVSLEDFKGKYLFVDFWGTWCKPCVEEFPALTSLYQQINKEEIAFLGIASEDTPESLGRFLKKRLVPWPLVLSDSINKIIETYNIDMFPSNFIIGPDGRIVAKNLHKEKLENKFRELGVLR
ncbi:hypothetical protein GCM10011325_22760 [Dyadobacter sediminis]|nr:hypothetical protein GCM10011325_22760 [Dyadobacter sediminis]